MMTQNEVVIKSITSIDRWDDLEEITEVYVNGKLIGCGEYGSEPEDNTRSRDYRWVEELLEKLASSLGATVKVVSDSRIDG